MEDPVGNPLPHADGDRVTQILKKFKEYVFPKGEEAVANVTRSTFTQKGEMRFSPESKWVAFSAEQWSDAKTSAFKWVAHFFPLLTVTDEYTEDRHGELRVRFCKIVPLMTASGPEFDQGEVQRYLAELAWCPFALLRNEGLRFEPVPGEEHALRVHDIQDPTHGTVDLHFDADTGACTSIRAMRHRKEGSALELCEWRGTCLEYTLYEDCVRMPSKGEVMWMLPEEKGGAFVYWKAEWTSVHFVRADA